MKGVRGKLGNTENMLLSLRVHVVFAFDRENPYEAREGNTEREREREEEEENPARK